MSDYVIVGDCGGTNTRLSLWEIPHDMMQKVNRTEKAPGTLIFDQKFLNEKFDNFKSIVKTFIKEANATQTPKAACLACAGPILDNTVNFTNISSGWSIDGKDLEKELSIPRVLLVNDFTAMGYGLLTLKAEECFVLNDVPARDGGVVATIGAGTGLGECFLSRDPKKQDYVCWATEGGHTDWPPRDDEEFELLQFLRMKFQQKARVSVERVISGPGIATIYEFLTQKYPEQVNQSVQSEYEAAGSLKGGVVAQHADNDKLCGKAMQIFFDAYASEAGNAMLKWLPTGGFYITGGIAAKNLKYIQDTDRFKSIMFEKGRVSPAIEQCPVYVAKVDDVGERGAHLVAYNLLLALKGGAPAVETAPAPAPTPATAAPTPATAETKTTAETETTPAAPPPAAETTPAAPATAQTTPAAPAATPAAPSKTPAPAPAAKPAAPAAAAAKKDKKKKKDCVVQ